MKRDMKRLNEIATEILRKVDTEHHNLGMVLQVFDSRGPAERPVAIVLHGINADEAIRMTRRSMDVIEKAENEVDEERILRAPLLVKPVG